MKKRCLLIIVTIAISYGSMACDICGCGVGNSYIGILPDFNKRIIGLRYRYNSIFTHVGIGGASTYLTTDERYRT
ncbi:MAG: transporter, partial [Flavitalea sp.]